MNKYKNVLVLNIFVTSTSNAIMPVGLFMLEQ
jgi:hypothetical protein